MTPRVSLVCPLHNKGKYVKATIESVLAQSNESWEMLVIENGSTDNGPKKVQDIADPRVRLIDASKHVAGPGAARNVGIQIASGEWIMFLDADDLIEKNHLEELVEVSTKNDAEIIASGWCEFREGFPADKEIKEPMGRGESNFEVADHAIAFAPWAVHCAIVRRRCLTKEFHWNENLDKFPSEDTAFWFKLVSQFSSAYATGCTAIYRMQTLNFRNQFQDVEKWFEAMDVVTQSNLDFLESRNQSVNSKQSESLMRMWADVAERAIRSESNDVAAAAFNRSQQWLEKCAKLNGINTWPLRIRSFLSVHRFHQLKYLVQKTRLIN